MVTSARGALWGTDGTGPFISFERRGVSVGELYFRETAAEEVPQTDLLRVLGVLEPNSRGPWRRRETLVVDLEQPEGRLFDQMSKGTKYKVRRAMDRDDVEAEAFHRPPAGVVTEFADYYDEFARAKSLPPIFRPRLEAMARSGMLFLTRIARPSGSPLNGAPLAWHAYAASGGRSILLHSASLYRQIEDSGVRNMIGRANRYLHWFDMLELKGAGYREYDLGGIDASRRDRSTAQIADFKQGFGGRIHSIYSRSVSRSAKGRLARLALRLRRIDF